MVAECDQHIFKCQPSEASRKSRTINHIILLFTNQSKQTAMYLKKVVFFIVAMNSYMHLSFILNSEHHHLAAYSFCMWIFSEQ